MPRIHFLNAGSMFPMGQSLLNGTGHWWQKAFLPCMCLVVETSEGLILVDAGIGLQDVENPSLFGTMFNVASRPAFERGETLYEQVKALGFQPEDVRHIIMTHLDLDHAGGLPDFPQAKVHTSKVELDAAMNPENSAEKQRYKTHHWAHQPDWETYEFEEEAWMGLHSTSLQGLPSTIKLVFLPGHSRGHCGIALQTNRGWLLHCGDAYFHRDQLHPEKFQGPWGIEMFQSMVQWDKETRLHSLHLLQQLAQVEGENVTFCCSHDPDSFRVLEEQGWEWLEVADD